MLSEILPQETGYRIIHIHFEALSKYTQYSKSIDLFSQSDNEFRTRELRAFCSHNGIILENSAPYSSYQKDAAEIMNKIIQYKMRKLPQGGKVHKILNICI